MDEFINPPSISTGAPLIWALGSSQYLNWTTTYSGYSLYLYNSTGIIAATLLPNVEIPPGIWWTVEVGSSDLTVNSIFWFEIENDGGDGVGHFDSEKFNIVSASLGSSSTVVGTTSAPSSTQSSTSGAGVGLSLTSSSSSTSAKTSLTSSQTTSSAPAQPLSSRPSSRLMSILAPTIICSAFVFGLIVWYYWKRRVRNGIRFAQPRDHEPNDSGQANDELLLMNRIGRRAFSRQETQNSHGNGGIGRAVTTATSTPGLEQNGRGSDMSHREESITTVYGDISTD